MSKRERKQAAANGLVFTSLDRVVLDAAVALLADRDAILRATPDLNPITDLETAHVREEEQSTGVGPEQDTLDPLHQDTASFKAIDVHIHRALMPGQHTEANDPKRQ